MTMVFCPLAGYAFAKYTFPGKNALFGAVMLTLMLPTLVLIIPLLLEMSSLGWVNTYQALILPGSVDAFSIFWMRQVIAAIPDELLDAGAGRRRERVRDLRPGRHPGDPARPGRARRADHHEHLQRLRLAGRRRQRHRAPDRSRWCCRRSRRTSPATASAPTSPPSRVSCSPPAASPRCPAADDLHPAADATSSTASSPAASRADRAHLSRIDRSTLPMTPRTGISRAPHFDRSHTWSSLNGEWDFEPTPTGRGRRSSCRSPGRPGVRRRGPLAAGGLVPPPGHRPRRLGGARIVLHFGAVHHEATVWSTTSRSARHVGGYTPFEFGHHRRAARRARRSSWCGSTRRPTSGRSRTASSAASRATTTTASRFTPSSGIWQSVWLEARPAVPPAASDAAPGRRAGRHRRRGTRRAARRRRARG